ncbi:MAG: right-handed parallel beta-helix repeat-containing protein [Anaerohalosphaeraceae bacterium]|nr:right-handed parallel beta-helix repeat-containing protein [Anaerohalosphaeraceae bacterium]
MKIQTAAVLAIVIALACSKTSAMTYYVSFDGSDESGGTSKQEAFRTIGKGVSVLKAGDTVIIGYGNYGNEQVKVTSSGKKDAPVTIKAETPGKVIMQGDRKGRAFSIVGQSHITIEGIKFTKYYQGIYIRRASYITVKNCIFYNNEAAGITLNDSNQSEFDSSHHHLFTENQFLDYATSGQGSPLSGGGIQDYGLCMYFSSKVEVVNNYFYGHHHQCCSFKEVMVDCRAAGNIFEGAYYTAIYLGQNEDKEAGYKATSRNLTVENNIFRPTPEYRLKSAVRAGNVTGAIIRNNFINAPNGYSGCGIGVKKSARDVKIYGNIITDTASGRDNPAIRIAADCEIYNNTIANCHCGLQFVAKAKVICKNNIFYKNTRPIHRDKRSGGDYAGSIFEYNCWFPNSSGKGAKDISVNPEFVGPIKPLKFNPYNPGVKGKDGRIDCSGRAKPTGQITLTAYVPKFTADFKGVRAYQLSGGSPCIDGGIDVKLPFVGKTPDIGAFEFSEKK